MVESGLGLPNTILQYLRQLNGVSMRVDLRFSCQNIKASSATLISLLLNTRYIHQQKFLIPNCYVRKNYVIAN